MITVIENFVPKQYQDYLEKEFFSSSFPLYLTTHTVYPVNQQQNLITDLTKDSPQFFHKFFGSEGINSNYWGVISPLCFKFLEQNPDYSTFKVKLNLNVQDNNFYFDNYYVPHTDMDVSDGMTGIYYVCDSDGDTLFFDDNKNVAQRFTPKKGVFVYFDSNTVHAGQPPKKSMFRCLVNFNFIKSA